MKLFGKKGNDTQAPDNSDLGEDELGLDGAPDAGPDASDLPASADEQSEAPALTAPSRRLASAAGGGKRNLIVLGALALIGASAVGYFMFMGNDYSAPEHVTAQSSPMPVSDIPPQPATPPADIAAATPPAADPAAPAPAADPLAAADPLSAPQPAAADPLAATPPAPDATAAADPAAPAAAPAADPLAAAPPAPTAADAALGTPPTDEAVALTPVPVDPVTGAPTDAAAAAPVTPAPGEVAPDLPLPGDPAAATGAATPPAPDAASTTTAATPPGVDLPMPDMPDMPTPAEAAPSWAAPGTAAVPGTTNPAAKASSPNDAELAIVQNAAVLDQLSRPADVKPGDPAAAAAPTGMPFDPSSKPAAADVLKQLQQNLEQTAVRRSLPSGYMTIRKESDAGDMDSRLTSARTALAQGRSLAALELFDDLKKDFPKDRRVLMGRAVSLQKLGQSEEALAAYEAVLNRDPKNLDALSNMLGLLKSRDPGLAVAKLQELRDAYPYQGDITAQLGIAYAENGNYEQAAKYLEMADSLKPGSAYVLYNRAVLLDRMGRSKDAGLLYRRILRMAADGELDQQLPLETIRNRLGTLR